MKCQDHLSGFLLIIPLFFILNQSDVVELVTTAFWCHVPELVEKIFRQWIVASDSLPAVWLSLLVCNLLWFMGIHGALIVTGIMYSFWMSNILDNQAALAAGQVLPHIYVHAFWDFLSVDWWCWFNPAASVYGITQSFITITFCRQTRVVAVAV